MNKQDIVISLAMANAARFAPLSKEDAEDMKVPFFSISARDQFGKRNISMYNYHAHDNAPRMKLVCDYVSHYVLPNVQGDVSGCYPIQLHDSYTHIGAEEQNILVFAKNKSHRKPVLLSDPYMMHNYGGILGIKDTIPFDTKVNKVCFYGCTTGNTDPKKNQRLRLAEWALSHQNTCRFKITNIVQMPRKSVADAYPNLDAMVQEFVPPSEQLRNRYILSLDGNTASYDRPCWIMNSKSLMMKYISQDILWYYPMILENQHFLGVETFDEIEKKQNYAENNRGHVEYMILNANQFVNTFLTPSVSMLYTTHLFECFAENK